MKPRHVFIFLTGRQRLQPREMEVPCQPARSLLLVEAAPDSDPPQLAVSLMQDFSVVFLVAVLERVSSQEGRGELWSPLPHKVVLEKKMTVLFFSRGAWRTNHLSSKAIYWLFNLRLHPQFWNICVSLQKGSSFYI